MAQWLSGSRTSHWRFTLFDKKKSESELVENHQGLLAEESIFFSAPYVTFHLFNRSDFQSKFFSYEEPAVSEIMRRRTRRNEEKIDLLSCMLHCLTGGQI